MTRIPDEAMRRSFPENVAENREIVRLSEAMEVGAKGQGLEQAAPPVGP